MRKSQSLAEKIMKASMLSSKAESNILRAKEIDSAKQEFKRKMVEEG